MPEICGGAMLVFNQLETYLYLALLLFAIGLYGVLARRNLIAVLISVELILNAASINFMPSTASWPRRPRWGRSSPCLSWPWPRPRRPSP